MLFFKPGDYEDFVFRLASLRVRPPADAWYAIVERQANAKAKRNRVLTAFSVAASIIAFVGLGIVSLQLSDFMAEPENQYSQLAVSGNSLSRVLTDPFEEPALLLSKGYLGRARIDLNSQVPVDLVDTKKDAGELNTLSRVIPIAQANVIRNDKVPAFQFVAEYRTQSESSLKNPVQKQGVSPWSFSAYLAPSYSYHTQGFSDLNYYSNERGAWMWSADITAKRRISRKLSFHTGLSLSPNGQNINDIILLTSNKVNLEIAVMMASTTYGKVSLDNQLFGVLNSSEISKAPSSVVKNSAMNKAMLRQRLYYIEAPLLLSYSLYTNMAEFELKFGASAGVLVGNRFILSGNNKKFYGKTEGVNPFNAALLAGVCISTPIGDDINLLLEPTFRLSAVSLNYNERRTFPFSSSFKVGLNYRFN